MSSNAEPHQFDFSGLSKMARYRVYGAIIAILDEDDIARTVRSREDNPDFNPENEAYKEMAGWRDASQAIMQQAVKAQRITADESTHRRTTDDRGQSPSGS